MNKTNQQYLKGLQDGREEVCLMLRCHKRILLANKDEFDIRPERAFENVMFNIDAILKLMEKDICGICNSEKHNTEQHTDKLMEKENTKCNHDFEYYGKKRCDVCKEEGAKA